MSEKKWNFAVSDKISGMFATAVARAKARWARAGNVDEMKKIDEYLKTTNDEYIKQGFVDKSAAWYLDVADCIFESDLDPKFIEFAKAIMAEAA